MSELLVDVRRRFGAGFELAVRFEARAAVTALFGPSGSGKTTLLSLLAGLQTPDHGRVVFNGQTLVDRSRGIDLPPERRHVGFVFQDSMLFPHLTVRRNLEFGYSESKGPIRFDRVVDVLEIGDVLDRRPFSLSGGQRQRVALGRALLSQPSLLLMDEPLSSLDEALRSRILNYLERVIAEWRIPTIYVSHHQVEVRRLAQWTLMLKDGRIVDEGETTAVLDRQAALLDTADAGPTYLLQMTDVVKGEGGWIGRLSGHLMSIPFAPPNEAGGPLWVQYRARDVILSRHDVAEASVRNQLHGVVRHVVNAGDRVLVAVDVGSLIWSEITPTARDAMGLKEGIDVVCLVKTRALNPVW